MITQIFMNSFLSNFVEIVHMPGAGKDPVLEEKGQRPTSGQVQQNISKSRMNFDEILFADI